MTNPLSTERASEIIGSIYDCVIDPSRWERVLTRICAQLEFANALLGVIRLPQGTQIHQSVVGMPADWLAATPAYAEDIVSIWGGAERIQRYPLDEPVVQSAVAGREVMEANRHFREQVAPRGLIDAVAFGIVRDANALGNIVFGRHGVFGPIDDQVINALRLLAPHFRRAITISNLFDMQAIEVTAFRATLDAVPFGAVIVDESLRILQTNVAAETMLSGNGPLRTRGGVLAVEKSSTAAILADAVSRAAKDEATIGQKGIGVPVTGAGQETVVMHVLPLRRGAVRSGLVATGAAAIFITAATRPLRMPIDAIVLLYDLTPAEARIFELVCDGIPSGAIAVQAGIARSTVKTHLNRIFEKTGCRRQADLVRLAAKFSL